MLRKMLTTDWDSNGMKAFDWGLAILSIGIGIWLQSAFWIVAGLLGAACAWYRPIGRFQRHLAKGFKRVRSSS